MITTVTIVIPLLGAILMLLLPGEARLVRYAALGVAAVPLLLVWQAQLGGNTAAPKAIEEI